MLVRDLEPRGKRSVGDTSLRSTAVCGTRSDIHQERQVKMSFAIPRLYVLLMLGLVASGFTARQALATATVFTQSYSATTAAGGTSMTSANAATVTVSRAA